MFISPVATRLTYLGNIVEKYLAFAGISLELFISAVHDH